MEKVLLIDNYDSFVYNIAQYLGEQGAEVKVRRNDISFRMVKNLEPDKIVLSPGPGGPKKGKISIEVVKELKNEIPILGICLGHQIIAHVHGGIIKRTNKVMHGNVCEIYHDNKGLFSDIPSPFKAIRYNSLLVTRDRFPDDLKIIAQSPDSEIMGIKHEDHALYGLQFHPESILTEFGKTILKAFLEV